MPKSLGERIVFFRGFCQGTLSCASGLGRSCTSSAAPWLAQIAWLSAHRIDDALRSRKEGGRSASEEPMSSLGIDGLAKPYGHMCELNAIRALLQRSGTRCWVWCVYGANLTICSKSLQNK